MCKKLCYLTAAGLLAAVVLTQTFVGRYASHWADRAESRLKEKISMTDELAMIRKDVSKLDRDIEKAKSQYVEERVEANILARKVEQLTKDHATSLEVVQKHGKMLTEVNSKETVDWNGRSVSFVRAKELLASEVKTCKALERDLKANKDMLAMREHNRNLAFQHMQTMISQKAELEAAVLELEGLIKEAQIQQAESKYQKDSSRLSKIKQSMEDLKKRVEKQRVRLEVEKEMDPQSPVNQSVEDILEGLNKGNDQ
ncbi:MAG: hypothetical protein R3B84_15705 [Zavarzinella sp.]